uniref:Uncharacterized protein n=1 Tax=Peronospora matthiolae TaxID=2874970 RepID=A0AAV1TIC0_9STRA
MVRRRETQHAAHTPPAGSSDHSGEGTRPELALVMEQQAPMVMRLKEHIEKGSSYHDQQVTRLGGSTR